MKARRLKHVANVEKRDTQSTGDWNQPEAAAFTPDGTRPCTAWTASRTVSRDDNRVMIVEETRAIFMPDVALSEGDKITSIEKGGTTLYDGPFMVRTLMPVNGHHVEAQLERIA